MAIAYELDDTDWALIRELQADARITLTEASRRVGLTAPAVGERVRRLEEYGVVRGYHAEVDLDTVGRGISAFIRVKFSGKYELFERLVEQSPEILECHHITGEDCFIVKAAVPKMSDLERLATSLGKFGSTATSIIYSTILHRKVLDRL